jgi:hypothetical protein
MLAASKYVLELARNDRSEVFIIEGGAGNGKTAYGANIIAEVHSENGTKGNWDISVFKKYMGFHPIRVIDNWRHAHKELVYMWDDAGAWINAMDYQAPFIKDIGKMLQTMRTKYHCVIFTCLDADDLARKIRMHTGAVTIKISLMGSEPRSNEIERKYRRTAVAKHWDKDWYDKLYRKDDWEEYYCCYMPPKFHAWYQPIREHYADMLARLALKEARRTNEIRSTLKYSDI